MSPILRTLVCAAAILLTIYQTAFAGTVIQCDLPHGTLQQVTFAQYANGVRYSTLNNVGSQEMGGTLPLSQWEKGEFEFLYRGERFEIKKQAHGGWSYKVFYGSSTSPSIISGAYCE